jgi:hypothetical protein
VKLVGVKPVFANQEPVVVWHSGGQFLRSIEQAMKPAKETELMDEDDNLSRNSRCRLWRPLFLTLGVCFVFPNNATLQDLASRKPPCRRAVPVWQHIRVNPYVWGQWFCELKNCTPILPCATGDLLRDVVLNLAGAVGQPYRDPVMFEWPTSFVI